MELSSSYLCLGTSHEARRRTASPEVKALPLHLADSALSPHGLF